MAGSQREITFRAWAPADAIWSPWAKPVLFAHLRFQSEDPGPATTAIPPHQINLPPTDARTVIVVDLPAVESIAVGLALAALGYQPVPLFNALPGPRPSVLTNGPTAAVDLWPAARALWAGAPDLVRLALPANAPPAFLLDANRRGTRGVTAGDFDNRSVSLTTDFPSAATLGGAGISNGVLMADNPLVAEDLAHTLLRWQSAGITLRACFSEADSLTPLHIRRPHRFGMMFQRLLATAGLRSSPFGGFGGRLPIPSSGG